MLSGHSLTQTDADIIKQFHPDAIDKKFQFLARPIRADAEILDGELVFTIGREIVMDKHSAARAEREAFDVVRLSDITRRNVARFCGRLPVPNRHAGDSRRRRCIGFQQRRRDR